MLPGPLLTSGGRRAEDGLEAALGASEGRRPLLQRRRPRCCRLPQPGERGGRREQIAGDDGCYYFEQVGRHGVRRGYSRAGIIVNMFSSSLYVLRGVRRSALSEDSNLAKAEQRSPCAVAAQANRALQRPVAAFRTPLETWGAF